MLIILYNYLYGGNHLFTDKKELKQQTGPPEANHRLNFQATLPVEDNSQLFPLMLSMKEKFL